MPQSGVLHYSEALSFYTRLLLATKVYSLASRMLLSPTLWHARASHLIDPIVAAHSVHCDCQVAAKCLIRASISEAAYVFLIIIGGLSTLYLQS